MAALLCDRCRQIDFAALRGPSLSQLDDLYAGRNAGSIYIPNSEDATSRINLGTLKRMEQEGSRCQLCDLFTHIIDRQGAVGYSNRRLDTADICFVATAGGMGSYFGSIGTVEPFQPLGFILQRLFFTAHENLGDSGYGDCVADFSHVLHARRPGNVAYQADEKTYDAQEVTDAMLFGARPRPLQLNISLLRGWLNICNHEHGARCAEAIGKHAGRYPVRFIDVDHMSITTFTNTPLSDIRYIALSYVWGLAQHQKMKLIKTNAQQLGIERSLAAKEVPKTIEDAIELTKMLGFKYLWVDALCIVQDDPEDQRVQINNMHGIYKTAFLTIVAASGEHSDAGLPGLRPGTRQYEQREAIVIDPTGEDPGLSLVTNVNNIPKSWGSSYASGSGDIETSVWYNRAWTMQEKALSRRTITFSEEQVSWDCLCASFWEEAFFEIRNLRCRSIATASYQELSLVGLARNKTPWDLYRNLVGRYSQCNLSYPGDYNDAFAAVLEMMTEATGERFIWGLPCTRFNLALSWDTIYGVYRRDALSKLAMTSLNTRVRFPTWSWLGWVGHAHCSVGEDRTESETPTVDCYTHRNNPLTLLPIQNVGTANETTSYHSQSTVTMGDIEVHRPDLSVEVLSGYADEYLLFFWANIARFLVRPPDPETFAEHRSVSDNMHDSRPTIQNEVGARVGTACRKKGEHWAGDFSDRWYDFVAIGRRAVEEIPEYPAVILAMQIEWTGSVARRINIAEIREEEWVAASPRRVLVVLE